MYHDLQEARLQSVSFLEGDFAVSRSIGQAPPLSPFDHFYGAHFVGNAELDAVVVSDYSSWVRPDDGSKCGVFEPK